MYVSETIYVIIIVIRNYCVDILVDVVMYKSLLFFSRML